MEFYIRNENDAVGDFKLKICITDEDTRRARRARPRARAGPFRTACFLLIRRRSGAAARPDNSYQLKRRSLERHSGLPMERSKLTRHKQLIRQRRRRASRPLWLEGLVSQIAQTRYQRRRRLEKPSHRPRARPAAAATRRPLFSSETPSHRDRRGPTHARRRRPAVEPCTPRSPLLYHRVRTNAK